MFLLSAAYNVLGASIATADDDELAEKFEKVADLDEPSKSLNETTTSAIKVRDVTTEPTVILKFCFFPVSRNTIGLIY
jgi:hypothetical protein